MSTRSNYPRVTMPRQATATSQILENHRRPLSRQRLHQKADKFVAEALAATCMGDVSAVRTARRLPLVFMPLQRAMSACSFSGPCRAPVRGSVFGAEHDPK